MEQCYECHKQLDKDEIALNKKLLGKNIKQKLCLECLSEYLESDKDILLAKIEQFKDDGCELFE